MKKFVSIVMVIFMFLGTFQMLTVSGSNAISIGDTINLGTYNDEPIVWVCVDIDENGPLMLSKNKLCDKEYDAPGTSSTYHTDGWGYVRKNNGSNCWFDSNIRQWLNTVGEVQYTHCNPSYSDEVGFLSSFSSDELLCIKEVEQKTYVNEWETHRAGYVDGGNKESVDVWNIKALNMDYSSFWYQKTKEKVFLLSEKQLLDSYNNLPDVITSEKNYYTRISNNSGASYDMVRLVASNGYLDSATAYQKYGIRPAFYLDVDAYGCVKNNSSQFPEGYNFNKDKFPFENPKHSIPYTSFANFFGPLWGSIIYGMKSKASEKGTCFGMATATGALLKNYTSLGNITYKNLFGLKSSPDCINDIWNGTKGQQNFYIDSLNMTVSDYIDYGFLYQWGPWESWIEDFGDFFDSMKTLYNEVYDFVYNDGETVVINFEKGFSGHAVLAVGLKENSIYNGYDCTEIILDDSNYLEERSLYLLKNDEGKYFNWVFHFTDSEIWTGKTYSLITRKPSAMFTFAIQRMSNNLTYTLYEDYRLLTVDKEISLDSAETIIKRGLLWKLMEGFSETNTQETEINTDAYWLEDSYDEPLVFTSDELGGSFSYSTYDASISVDLPYDAACSINESDDNYINAEISTVKDKTISISKTEANSNNEKYVLKVTGSAYSDITATQTETGLLVTGISNGTVTLTKNDEIISIEEIKDAVGDIEITYGKNGEDEEVELDYHSHSYTSEITIPATHLAEGVITYICECNDSYTEIIDRITEHAFEKTEIAPTCEADGIITYTCSCGDFYTEIVSATGHSYADNGICEKCDNYDKSYDKSKIIENCSCNCHKSGFMGFIWKILNFFYKLFKMKATCACGVAHY